MNQYKFFTSVIFLFTMFLSSSAILAQDGHQKIDKDYTWDQKNASETFYLKVEPGAKEVQMNFDGKITEGAFFVSAYDPEGNKVGGFSLVCSGSESSHIHIHDSEGGQYNYNYIESGSGSNVHTESNGSSSSSNTTTTTTTTTVSEGSSSKEKNKSKQKNKTKIKDADNGTTSVYVRSNTGDKGAKGVMKKTISDPAAGKWKFVLEAKGVTGRVSAKISQE